MIHYTFNTLQIGEFEKRIFSNWKKERTQFLFVHRLGRFSVSSWASGLSVRFGDIDIW